MYSADEIEAARQALDQLKQKQRQNPVCARLIIAATPAKPSRPMANRSIPPTISKQPDFSSMEGAYPDGARNDNEYSEDVPRLQCPTCKRMFIEESFEKHQKVCFKVFVKKREAFNSLAMRLGDREDAAATIRKLNEDKKKEVADKNKASKQSNNDNVKQWKVKSLEFQARIGNEEAKKELMALKNSGAVEPTSMQCHICSRSFSVEAAKRHIPICEQNAHKAKVTGKKVAPTTLKKGGGIQASANIRRK